MAPTQTNGRPYLAAAANGNFSALPELVRLGCPWGGKAHTLPMAVNDDTPLLPWRPRGTGTPLGRDDCRLHGRDCAWQRHVCTVEGLAALVAAGCPVKWSVALAAGRWRGETAVTVWLEAKADAEEARRRRGSGSPGQRAV